MMATLYGTGFARAAVAVADTVIVETPITFRKKVGTLTVCVTLTAFELALPKQDNPNVFSVERHDGVTTVVTVPKLE